MQIEQAIHKNRYVYKYMPVTKTFKKSHEFEREQGGVCRRVWREEGEGKMI